MEKRDGTLKEKEEDSRQEKHIEKNTEQGSGWRDAEG